MDKKIAQIVGQLNEAAWSEGDLVNAILGAPDVDIRKGLMALKKGQLKRVYAAVSGKPDETADDETEAEEPKDDGPQKDIKALAGEKE